MRFKDLLIILNIFFMINCHGKKEKQLNEFIDEIKQSDFSTKFKGFENMYRRNCIFSFISPNLGETIYTINSDNTINVIRTASSNNLDIVRRDIDNLWKLQAQYNILSFTSNKDRIIVYFDTKSFNEETLISNDTGRKLNGALIYYYKDYRKNDRLKRIHESIKPKYVGNGWYFYLTPIINGAKKCFPD